MSRMRVAMFSLLSLLAVQATPINLKSNNFASIREPIDADSAGRLIHKLNSLTPTAVYLYINSPGGSVLAGLEVINYIKGLQGSNRTIHCIANNAMSMAFVILQYCTTRYVQYGSTLMQHQMSLSVEGSLANVNSRMAYLNQISTELTTYQAKRLDLSIQDFNQKVHNDWWLYSSDILKWKAADEITSVICDFPNFEENVTHSTLFGEVYLTYSACPLIGHPLRISFGGSFNESQKQLYKDKMNNYFQKL